MCDQQSQVVLIRDWLQRRTHHKLVSDGGRRGLVPEREGSEVKKLNTSKAMLLNSNRETNRDKEQFLSKGESFLLPVRSGVEKGWLAYLLQGAGQPAERAGRRE